MRARRWTQRGIALVAAASAVLVQGCGAPPPAEDDGLSDLEIEAELGVLHTTPEGCVYTRAWTELLDARGQCTFSAPCGDMKTTQYGRPVYHYKRYCTDTCGCADWIGLGYSCVACAP